MLIMAITLPSAAKFTHSLDIAVGTGRRPVEFGFYPLAAIDMINGSATVCGGNFAAATSVARIQANRPHLTLQ
jgi:hypothetical protein